MVILEESIGEGLLVTLLNGLDQVDQELVFPSRGEGRIDVSITFERAVCSDEILGVDELI